jgi:hypothetical protein
MASGGDAMAWLKPRVPPVAPIATPFGLLTPGLKNGRLGLRRRDPGFGRSLVAKVVKKTAIPAEWSGPRTIPANKGQGSGRLKAGFGIMP